MKPPPATGPLTRREFVRSTSALAASALASRLAAAPPDADPFSSPIPAAPPADTHPFLTPAADFEDVSRGNPKPFTLTGDALTAARLTPATWRLEVTADPTVDAVVKFPASVARPLTLADGTALDLPALEDLGRKKGVRFIKAMQCLNIPTPLGQGLWEGVPLRDVLALCGTISNVRRICYWGFHTNDPEQLFRSSLSYSQAMETPPGDLPPFLAYRLNGEPIPLLRGGPVRMVIPWAHGFKSVKWLQHLSLTNDFRANDTYAIANNDTESPLKTAAYLDDLAKRYPAGQSVSIGGLVISGWSGLKRVEYGLRRLENGAPASPDGDAAWNGIPWQPCRIAPPPADWRRILPKDVPARDVLGFDAQTGQPSTWPLRYSMVTWSATLKDLAPGHYEVGARAVDLNGFAQPEPRPVQKAGRNPIQTARFEIA